MADYSLVSAAVLSTDLATAAQYNNARTDAISHTHSGGSTPVVAMLNAKYLTGENASGVAKALLGVDAANVLQLGAAGLTVNVPVALSVAATLGVTGAATVTSAAAAALAVGANGATNPVLKVDAAAASVATGLKVSGAAAGAGVTLAPISSGSNEDLVLAGLGTGKAKISASYGAIQADADGATITFDMSVADDHAVTLGGNRTLAVSNVSTGQKFLLALKQDGTGSRTVTWFSGVSWAGGVAPTLTTTAAKTDLVGFRCTGAGAYQGFVVAQNL